HPRARRNVYRPHYARRPRATTRSRSVRPHQPLAAREPGSCQRDAAVVPRRAPHPAERRPRADVDAALPLGVQGRLVPPLGPLVTPCFELYGPFRDTRRMRIGAVVLLLVLAGAVARPFQSEPNGTWNAYGGDPGGTRYSPLRRIDKTNVTRLRVAWTYHTGALEPQTALNSRAAFESTPILIGDTLYLT